tara:strand:+ start:83 stop:319 length:237 start_codon:yes stop_codon:yes gene_type:complete
MFDNNLIFSLILSLINTGIFLAMTHKDNFEQRKQEYIMLFGITFITSFLMKSCINVKDIIPNLSKTTDIMSQSSRPPF